MNIPPATPANKSVENAAASATPATEVSDLETRLAEILIKLKARWTQNDIFAYVHPGGPGIEPYQLRITPAMAREWCLAMVDALLFACSHT
jgi:hypothetical protein